MALIMPDFVALSLVSLVVEYIQTMDQRARDMVTTK